MTRDRTRSSIREHMRACRTRFGELDHLTETTGISRAQARELIKRYGNNRQTLLSHARALSTRSPSPSSNRSQVS